MSDPEHPGIRWFGEPWPSPDERAGVCEDESLHVDPPLGSACIVCGWPIQRDHQGVQLPTLFGGEPAWTWMAYHLECFLQAVLGGRWREGAQ